jgi:hypothetical protein
VLSDLVATVNEKGWQPLSGPAITTISWRDYRMGRGMRPRSQKPRHDDAPGCTGPPTMANAMGWLRPGRPNSGLSGRIPLKNADLPAIDHPGA